MNNDLITITECENNTELYRYFTVTIDRFPDCIVHYDPELNTNCTSLQMLRDCIYGKGSNTLTFCVYDEGYETYQEDYKNIHKHNNIMLYVNNKKQNIIGELALVNKDGDISHSVDLTDEEVNELVNKLLEILDMHEKGEL